MSEQIISPEGYEKLKNELKYLTTVKRREVAERIERAKELGDLSENAEYSEAKDAQALNEGKVLELTNSLKNVTVVDNKKNGHEVSMGSTITVKTNNSEKIYTIVSFNEADPINGLISNESPIGLAFLGKKKGDKVKVQTPRGEIHFQILKIN